MRSRVPSLDDDDFGDFQDHPPPPPIHESEIINNDLIDHRNYNQWRARLDRYLVQEGLHYVLERPFQPPLLGLTPGDEERTNWIDYTAGEAKVKAILLHTIPIENFKENKDPSAYDIMVNVSRECAIMNMREEVTLNPSKKRKMVAEDGGL